MGYRAARYVRGKHLNNKGYGAKNPVPMEMPQAVVRDTSPVEIAGKEILVLSDLHVPYHDMAAIKCAIEWERKKGGIDTVLLNGDFMDCYWESDFAKVEDGPNTEQEVEIAGRMLDYLQRQFPKARFIWKQGNHEARWNIYLATHAMEMRGLPQFSLQSVMGLKERGIQWVDGKRTIKAGGLSILHGHELPSGIAAPVNPARGLWLKYKAPAACAHSHVASEHTEKTGNDEVITCWSFACLCDLKPYYRPINNYCHGYGRITIHGPNNFHVKNHRINNGKMV